LASLLPPAVRRQQCWGAAKLALEPSQVRKKALCFGHGKGHLLVIAVELKPPEVLIDRRRRLLGFCKAELVIVWWI
jgi:hypothetical protein